MIFIILAVLCIAAAVVVPKLFPMGKIANLGIRVGLAIFALLFICSTSYVHIDADKVGHLKRVYLASDLPAGRIIALPGQKGPQAEILGPGFHFRLLLNVLYDVDDDTSVVNVPEGKCAYLVAKDGRPLGDGQFMADAISRDQMLDAMWFMGLGNEDGPRGQKGPQLTVLPPGDYRINRYLFDVYAMDATDIPIGNVGVVKSNVGKEYTGESITPSGVEFTNLSVPIVPRGYRGVWQEVLEPGRYYLNTEAYNVTIIPTQIQTWKYLGGYTQRFIDLEIQDDGQIKQSVREKEIPVPKDAADSAVLLKVESWEIPQDGRIQVQVTPENAPFVVAAAGGLTSIEDKIITPTFRSVLRNEVAKTVVEPKLDEEGNPVKDKNGKVVVITRPRRALDLLYKREETEQAVEKKLIPEGAKVGLTVMEVRFGDPAVPPELLLPGKRKQLASQMITTYQQEKLAQTERVQTMKERARADQQPELMKSEIGKTVAKNNAERDRLIGIGQKDLMRERAKGLQAEAGVLGKDAALELAKLKIMVEAAKENPDMVKQPHVLVISDGDSLTGAAAVFGANNFTKSLEKARPQTQK